MEVPHGCQRPMESAVSKTEVMCGPMGCKGISEI